MFLQLLSQVHTSVLGQQQQLLRSQGTAKHTSPGVSTAVLFFLTRRHPAAAGGCHLPVPSLGKTALPGELRLISAGQRTEQKGNWEVGSTGAALVTPHHCRTASFGCSAIQTLLVTGSLPSLHVPSGWAPAENQHQLPVRWVPLGFACRAGGAGADAHLPIAWPRHRSVPSRQTSDSLCAVA